MLAPPPLPRTLDASIRDLSSEKPNVRQSAVVDLVRHALLSDAVRARSIPLFEKRMVEDESPRVRSSAAVALADLRAVEALPTLLVAVEDADAHVRQMALNALGEIGDPRARQRLERALEDERPEVRYQAVIAYTRVVKDEPDEIARALVSALSDEDDAIRYIALRLAEESFAKAPVLVDEGVFRTGPAGAVAKKAKHLLGDASPQVRLAAAIFLARGGDPDARKILRLVIRDGMKGAEPEDEQAAIEMAGEIGLTEAKGDLERRVWGFGRLVRDTFAWHARIALAAMGHPRAKGEILTDLASWRRETRQAAVVAAGKARLVEAKETLVALAGRVDAELLREAIGRIDGTIVVAKDE